MNVCRQGGGKIMENMEKGIEGKKNVNRIRRYITRLLVFIFWISVWEAACKIIDQELFLPSPESVLLAIIDLAKTSGFWRSIFNSFIRIIIGFSMGVITGAILAVFSYKSRLIYELISPFMKIIKSTPVASFIILALVWISSKNLSVLISFLMAMPISFSNLLYGLKSTDEKLLEMAKVFRMGRWKRIKAIYFPAVLPFLVSAVSVGLGFSFKSGIAAEVIGRPSNSIGLNLYEAKLYLMIKELFAWTAVIIIISVLFEKIVVRTIRHYGSNTGNTDKP